MPIYTQFFYQAFPFLLVSLKLQLVCTVTASDFNALKLCDSYMRQ